MKSSWRPLAIFGAVYFLDIGLAWFDIDQGKYGLAVFNLMMALLMLVLLANQIWIRK